MAKNDNLKDFLVDVADAIRNKKGTTELINPQDFSTEITSIQSGDIYGFDKIGYTLENNTIYDDIEYSEELLRQWDSGELTTFNRKSDMVYCPKFDSTKVANFAAFFYSCSSLRYMPYDLPTSHITYFEACWQDCLALTHLNVDTSKSTNLRVFVSNCQKLIKLSPIDCSNAKMLGAAFSYCYRLKEIDIRNTNGVTNMSKLVYNCIALTRIATLDLSSVTDASGIFSYCSKLVFVAITNLGKSALATYDFSGATAWGTEGEENRQSLIDSLITYSYDRASNGMTTATIQLSDNTKALLTEEDIAQITAKGFTIS